MAATDLELLGVVIEGSHECDDEHRHEDGYSLDPTTLFIQVMHVDARIGVFRLTDSSVLTNPRAMDTAAAAINTHSTSSLKASKNSYNKDI